VKVRSTNGLARYSFGNQLLIAMQRTDATYVAGFRAFLELNRCVRKGERAIRILAPMTLGNKDERADEAKVAALRDEPRRTVFRAVPVFDVSQTDPLPGTEPVLLVPPQERVEGDTHAHLLAPLQRLAAELGYSVRPRPLDGSADGWCDNTKREIVLNGKLAANAQVRVLVHELAHALGVGYRDYGRQRAEVLVDTVTYVVCGSVGLDVSGSSVPYVAGWGEQGEPTPSAATPRQSTRSHVASKTASRLNHKPTRLRGRSRHDRVRRLGTIALSWPRSPRHRGSAVVVLATAAAP
jgi:N-terminal domain of anti-restriction factor ArdC